MLATYYFMLLDVSAPHMLSMTKTQEGVLLDICKDIRRSREPRSLVFKLGFRVSCELFRTVTPEDETITRSVSRRSDSGIEDMEGDAVENGAGDQPLNGDIVR